MNLRLEKLSIYPLTAGPSIDVGSCPVRSTGPIDDRRLVLYDPSNDNKRMGAKECPAMFAAEVAIDDNGVIDIRLTGDEIKIPRNKIEGQRIMVNEFGDHIPCTDLGDEFAGIMSEANGRDVRLAEKSWAWQAGLEGRSPETRRLAPLHLVFKPTVEWVDEIAGHTGVDVRRFRPNLVLSGTVEPESELEFIGDTLLINQVPIRVTRATVRCAVTGYDPENGRVINDVPRAFKRLSYRENCDGKMGPVVGLYGYAEIDRPKTISVQDEVILIHA